GVTQYNYDPEKAVQLLEEAGYSRGGDGIFQKDGQRLSFDIMTNAGNVEREAIALLMQDNLAQVGIEIETSFVEWTVMNERYLWVGDFDMVISGVGWRADPDQYFRFHSSQAEKNAEGRFTGQNQGAFRNDEVDRLLEEGRRETDPAARAAIYADYQRLMSEELPYINLYAAIGTAAIPKDITNVIVAQGEGPILPWLWRRD
ncbi:MAG: ABC transporter substrate-binding protein, partial [Thermaerobacterales bacterium]